MVLFMGSLMNPFFFYIKVNSFNNDAFRPLISIVRSLALVRPCLGLFPLIVPTFLPSIFHTTL